MAKKRAQASKSKASVDVAWVEKAQRVSKSAVSKVEKSRPRGYKTGGRKKGTPNKKNAAVIKAVEEGGITPLEYMLRVMRDPRADGARRDDMAKSAAPYVHSRLSAVEHKGADGGPIDMHWTVEFVKP